MGIIGAVLGGLILGSFLSVLIARWPQWRGVAVGRSHCPHCLHELRWYDLVPLLSWLTLRGKCRYCDAPISSLYPTLEFTMALVLGAYAWRFGVSDLWSLTDMVILFGLVSLFFFDLRWHMLPDIFTRGLSVLVLARIIFLRPELLAHSLITGGVLAVAFFLLYMLTRRRGIGLGDVKLAFLTGVLLGYPDAVSVTLIAIWFGALVGVMLMTFHRASLKTALPFGSFWTATIILAMLWPSPFTALSSLITS